MKKFFRMLVLTICIIIMSVPVFANEYDTMLINEDWGYDPTIANGIISNSIKVQLNGDYIDFTDAEGNKVEPQIVNDRTMVPMRKIFEVFGSDVEWIPETRSIKATTEELEIGLQIDNTKATLTDKNGVTREIILDSAPVIIDNRTLVPVRFIAESLSKKVGWDADNRTVIVIDTSFIDENLKEKTSNLYEYLTTDLKKIDTCEMNVDITGKVKYDDFETRDNNTTINILGDMDIKVSETAIQLDLDLNLTGKGLLLETIKEEGLEKIEASIIVDIEGNNIYIKSPLVEGYENKWLQTCLCAQPELKEAIKLAQNQKGTNLDMIIDTLIAEENLTVTTYTEAESILQLITMFMSNENFKVSGRTTKTYTYNLDLSEVLAMLLPVEDMEENEMKFEFGFDVKIADGVEKESNCNMVLEFSQEPEKIAMDIKAKAILESYNEKVTIKIPAEKDVVNID